MVGLKYVMIRERKNKLTSFIVEQILTAKEREMGKPQQGAGQKKVTP